MREVFACFDKDSSGAVTTAELAVVLKSMNKNYTESEIRKIISKFDVNGQNGWTGGGGSAAAGTTGGRSVVLRLERNTNGRPQNVQRR